MKNKIDIVVWRDIHALRTQWRTIENADDEAKRLFNLENFTVGVIIFEDEHMVSIASTFDGEDLYNDISMIPKSVIIRRESLFT